MRRALENSRHIALQSRPVRYAQNGLRVANASETLARIKEVLLATPLEIRFERRWVPDTPFSAVLLHFSSREATADEVYLGKGLDYDQCMVSAFMEFIERFCARITDKKMLIEARYKDVKVYARDPRQFVLPLDSSYKKDSKIDWVWGYSLTRREPVLVPANMVFLPYVTDRQEKNIAGSDSNGLASGNCIEEAILHGIMEVIERDARFIMEYNYIAMPDVEIDHLKDKGIARLLKNLGEARIDVTIKDITNNIPVPSIGVFLEGASDGKKAMSYACGTYIHPEIALSRALTEALQLYPRCANYQEWLKSGPIDHLYRQGSRKVRLSAFAGASDTDLKENINRCVETLKKFDAEVIVVDISRPELSFSVVRICVTNLQPLMYAGNPRVSRRLCEVPVILGWRENTLKPEDIKFRQLPGYRQDAGNLSVLR
jgi:thioglycine synthase